MSKNKNILLIGGSGKLGSSIIKSKLFKNLYSPKKRDLNILDRKSIKKIINKDKFDLIINCAAMARIIECEKNKSKAINVNIKGTYNLVKEILDYENRFNKKIKLIHISSDGVYPSSKGNYSEKSSLEPYNIYGWTKLASEFIVKLVDKHVIIRTRFFDKKLLTFKKSANDIFTSSLEVDDLVKKIKILKGIRKFLNFSLITSKIKPEIFLNRNMFYKINFIQFLHNKCSSFYRYKEISNFQKKTLRNSTQFEKKSGWNYLLLFA